MSGATAAPGRIQALLMDADGVLQLPRDGWLSELAELGEGVDFLDELFEQGVAPLDGSVDLADVLDDLIRRRRLDTRPEQIIEVWQSVDLFWPMLELVADVRRGGVVTALATNQHSYRGSWMKQALPYREYFDREFYSFEMGVAKPDPAYFEQILDHLAVPADAAVFVDDRAENVDAAGSVGLHTVWCPTPEEPDAIRAQLRELGVPGA